MSIEAPTCTGSRITIGPDPGNAGYVIMAIRGPRGGCRRREQVHQEFARALAAGILAVPAGASVATRAGATITVGEVTGVRGRAITVPDLGDCLVLAFLGRRGDVRNRELLAREAAWKLADGLLAMLRAAPGADGSKQEGAGQ